MNFPPQFIDEIRNRISLAEIAGRKLAWDKRKSNPGKGDYWACCPFHQEKTSSFHLDDRKGFYYCFGCHEKGDLIGFTMKMENLSFPEAVITLARQAGLPLPEQSERDEGRHKERATLASLMEDACRFYRGQLQSAAAEAARTYLERRGLSPETLATFEIGYAPPGGLFEHSQQAGVEPRLMEEAGLCARREDGSWYDRFRDRIIFPIRAPSGQCIAFGGRAMSDKARAKYLNSPETPLFSKSRTLYNLGPGRAAAGQAGGLIVAEGYMDVIALYQAGLEHAVAPLGTALTEDHLMMLWRVADSPTLALDGDQAGLRAALRVVDLALPKLRTGKTLHFALMPEGQDPDDVVRTGGRTAFERLLEEAVSLVDMLWRDETGDRDFTSPDARAALDGRLRRRLTQIQDAPLRRHYGQYIQERRAELFGYSSEQPPHPQFTHGRQRKGPGRLTPWRGRVPERPLAQTVHARKNMQPDTALANLEAALLMALIRHPGLLEAFEEELISAEFFHPQLDMIRNCLISLAGSTTPSPDSDRERYERTASALRDQIGEDVEAILMRYPAVGMTDFVVTDDAATAHNGIEIAFARLASIDARRAERDEAQNALDAEHSDVAYKRLSEAKKSHLDDLRRGFLPSEREKDGKKDRLQSFIDEKIWIKKRNQRANKE